MNNSIEPFNFESNKPDFKNTAEILEAIRRGIDWLEGKDEATSEFQLVKNKTSTSLFILFDEIARSSEEGKKNLINAFEKEAPEIYADVVSALDNPNCSCRGKVGRFLMQNLTKSYDIISKVVLESPEPDPDFFNNVNLKFEKVINKIVNNNNGGDNNVLRVGEPKRNNNEMNQPVRGQPQSIAGSSFLVKKDSYRDFLNGLYQSNAHFRGLSVVDLNRDDLIEVYFY